MTLAFGYLRWTPDTFWAATITEFFAAIDGLNEVNQAKSGKPKVTAPTQDELDKLLTKYGKG